MRRRLFRHLPVVGAAALLLIIGGSGLLAAAFSAGPAGADSTLGGFTVTSLAEAVTAQYEQPNFPLPATPSLEFDEGYAATSDNFGPSGTATASSLYPGQVVANAGPELALLVPGAPLPPAPVWPVEATSEYPQTPELGVHGRARREHGRLEHDEREHRQRHPRRRCGDRRLERRRPDAAGALELGQPARRFLRHHRHRQHVGDVVVAGAQHDGQRPGQRDRQRHLHPRRLHHHRERHLDGDGRLGRDDGQAHRFDRGAERRHRRRAGDGRTAAGSRPPARARRCPSPSRPSTRCSASSASPSRSPTPPTASAGPPPAGRSTGSRSPSTSRPSTRRRTRSPRSCRLR